MSKEKVFIVISHKNQLSKDSHPGRGKNPVLKWEVSENVEFVNHVKNRHITAGSAIGDYINRKMISGARHGMTDYAAFEEYVRKKYEKQMKELDEAYLSMQVPDNRPAPLITDTFGNERERTVFDV